jgi:cell division protein ZapA
MAATVRVTIFNQPYTLAAAGESGEIESLATSVDELMTEIAIAQRHSVDSTKVAVLACLHLADRQRTLERELNGLKERVDQKSREFLVILDEAMK